ncbi:UDP-N-acetylglucosamine pyrophosphorylase protein [gamma proteobacterium HdN1]|nr:UDP-N-acetylglucosamine pyrophosphorylase protein [gamma proteobacterium HdN1]
MKLDVVILAAGKGTRMKSFLPKVLQPLAKRPLLSHILETSLSLNAHKVAIVFGHGGDQVQSQIKKEFSDAPIAWVEQQQQLGTGHAVSQALPVLDDDARALILYGDVPLTSIATLVGFQDSVPKDQLGVLTIEMAVPTGYGRIIRGECGQVVRIVEEKDASVAEKAVTEVNTGIMVAPAARLKEWLPRLSSNNAQGEYYLTDIVKLANEGGVAVQAVLVDDPMEVEGVNDKRQLAKLERLLQAKHANHLMAMGATLADPARVDVRGQVEVGSDCFIDVNVVFEGRVVLGNNVEIGPNCLIKDSVIGNNTTIKANSMLDNARLADHCDVGPFARLRPGAELASAARVGNFVEVKNTYLGAHSKANHLAYLGDCEIGTEVNVGAGTITCNYDGVNKHKTRIGDGAFIGSNSSLVAPLEIGAGATIGAGSTITRKAEADALTVTRAKQTTIEGWRRPTKK